MSSAGGCGDARMVMTPQPSLLMAECYKTKGIAAIILQAEAVFLPEAEITMPSILFLLLSHPEWQQKQQA